MRHSVIFALIAVLAVTLCSGIIVFSESEESSAAGAVVTFNANGGTVKDANNNTIPPYSTPVDSPVYVPSDDFDLGTSDNISRYIYAREGYAFLGWSTTQQDPTAADYSPVVDYLPGSLIPSSNASFSVYAVWEKNSYAVNLVYSDSYTRTIYIPYGQESQDLRVYMNYVPEGMEGYKIVGWHTVKQTQKDNNGAYLMPTTGTRYSQIAHLDMGAENINLYPIWGKVYVLTENSQTTITRGTGCYYFTAEGKLTGGGLIITGGSPKVFVDSLQMIFAEIVDDTTVNHIGRSPFVIQNVNNGNTANVELTVMTNCTFAGGRADSGNNNIGYAGINVKDRATLTVSQYSEGILTAYGGDAFNSYTGGMFPTARTGYPGAGIGSNGNENCGTIIIQGGTVIARGGDCIIDMDSTGWGSYNTDNAKSAPGIGGTGNRSNVTISEGTVTSISGNVHGQHGTDCSDTYVINDWRGNPVGTESDPIQANSETISTDATVTEIHSEGATVNVTSYRVDVSSVKDTGGTESSIGNAYGININGNSIYLGGMSVSKETTWYIPQEYIGEGHPNFDMILTTGHNNFFTGTAIYQGNKYTVELREHNELPRGLVKIYMNRESISGSEGYAVITPYQDISIAGADGDTRVLQSFEIYIGEGYQFIGLQSSTDGNTWTDRSLISGESISSGNPALVNLYFDIAVDGVTSYISFTVTPIPHTITYSIKHNEDDNFVFIHEMVTTDDNNPDPITWNDGVYTLGTQTAYHKSAKALVIKTAYGSENPFNILLVTINGQNVTLDLVNNGDGTFSLEVADITKNLTIEIHYRPLMMVKAYHPDVDGDPSKTDAEVILVDADGNKIPLIPGPAGVTVPEEGGVKLPAQGHGSDSNGSYTYAFVNRNDNVYFKILDYKTLKDQSGPTEIAYIKITIGSTTYKIPSGVDESEIYQVTNVYEDAAINVRLSAVILIIHFKSFNGATEGESTIITLGNMKTVSEAYINMPTAESLAEMDNTTGGQAKMYVKQGYKLLRWESASGYSVEPGSLFSVYAEETFVAVWDTDPETYMITYVLNGGTNNPNNPTSYNVTFDAFSILPATRDGYTCTWSVNGSDPTDSPLITPGAGDQQYHEDLVITAYWTANNALIVYHDNLPSGYTDTVQLPGTYNSETDQYETRSKRVGEPFGKLPFYHNFTYNNETFSFGGWAMNQSGTQRVTENTLIPGAEVHLYIIWITDNGEYIINLKYEANEGFVALSALTGSENDVIHLDITPASGYESLSVLVNGNPLEGFERGDTEADVTLTNGPTFFTIEVVFIPLEYYIKVLRPYSQDAETVEVDGTTYYVMETEGGTQYYMRIIEDVVTYYNPSTMAVVTVSEDTYYVSTIVTYTVLNNDGTDADTVVVDNVTYFVMKTKTDKTYYMRIVEGTPKYYNPSTMAEVTVSETTYYVHSYHTYSIVSEPIYITKPLGNAYLNHTFYGWTGTGIANVERDVIQIPTGSYGDRRYIEIWNPNTYSINYVLDGGTHSNPMRWNVGEELILGNAVKPGKIFEGWYRSYDGSVFSNKIEGGVIPDTQMTDLTVYARFIDGILIDFPFDTVDGRDDTNQVYHVTVNPQEYNGLQQQILTVVVVDGHPAYSMTEGYYNTYAGTYHFRVDLKEGFMWDKMGGVVIDASYKTYSIEVDWSITPRTLYISTPSFTKVYDGLAKTFADDCYKTLGLTYSDFVETNRFAIHFAQCEFTNVGENVLTVTVDDSLPAYSSYTIVYIYGTCVILAEDCATFTVPINTLAPSPDPMSAFAVSHMQSISTAVLSSSRRLIG